MKKKLLKILRKNFGNFFDEKFHLKIQKRNLRKFQMKIFLQKSLKKKWKIKKNPKIFQFNLPKK